MEDQQQPQPEQTVAVSVQPINVAPIPQNTRPWASSLFGFCDDFGGFCYGYFCFPCLACKVAAKLGENCCVPLCVPGGLMALRAKVRTMYGIQGTICNDHVVTCCCGGLALCQLDRELKQMGV